MAKTNTVKKPVLKTLKPEKKLKDDVIRHQLPTVSDAISAELTMIERAMTNPAFDIVKLETLLQMQDRVRAQKAKMSFNIAMRDTQAEIEPVTRDTQNDHTKKMFAKLESIDQKVRPIYTKYGFALSFDSKQLPDKYILVTCEVSHVDGHTTQHELSGPLDTVGTGGKASKTEMQGIGSTVSYLRRYLTCMIFNIVLKDEDKDGNNDKPKTNSFTEAMKSEKPKVTDAEFTEEPKPEGFAVVFQNKEFNKRYKFVGAAANYLKFTILKMEDKQDRLDALLDNIAIIKELEALEEHQMVKDLHAAANGVPNE